MLKLISQVSPGSALSDALAALQLTSSVPAAMMVIAGLLIVRAASAVFIFLKG